MTENQQNEPVVQDLKDQEIKKLTEKLENLVNFVQKNMVKKTDLRISVKTLSGKIFSVYVDQSDKISDVKSQIQEKEKIPVNKQYLFLDKALLDDNLKLSESNVKETSVLSLMKEDDEFLKFASVQDRMYFVDSLNKNVGKQIKCLLYDARRDGDDANTFHKNCDEQGPLLYVIKTTTDALFAIYVSKPICSDGSSKTDSLQMIISPSHNFSVKSKNNHATYHCQSNQGAHFHCMNIVAPFLSSNCNDIQSCSDFELPCYPSGNSSYKIKELQVFLLEEYH